MTTATKHNVMISIHYLTFIWRFVSPWRGYLDDCASGTDWGCSYQSVHTYEVITDVDPHVMLLRRVSETALCTYIAMFRSQPEWRADPHPMRRLLYFLAPGIVNSSQASGGVTCAHGTGSYHNYPYSKEQKFELRSKLYLLDHKFDNYALI